MARAPGTRRGRIAIFAAVLALLIVGANGLAATPDSDPESGQDYGAGLTLTEVTPLREIVSSPAKYEGRPVLLRGRISDVCQRKGCWTVLSAGDDHIRIRFKDYAFFLPTDSSGKHAYVEGYVKPQTLSEETARHYASESSEPPKEPIVGPQQVVGFTASGVRLLGED
jgi:hypothetical protein